MNAEQSGFVINHGDFRMQDWLLKADLSAGAKLTYSVLACCAGGRDYVWPSQEFLAEKVSVSVRTLQRYLNELVHFGLIEKCKQYIKGQVRNIYRFLLHSVIGLGEKRKPQGVVGNELPTQQKEPNVVNSDRHDTLSPRSAPILQQPVAKIEKPMPTDTTNCPDRHDKMSPALNKEETIKGKEYNPPTPLAAIPASQGDDRRDDSGKEGELNFKTKKEDSDWTQAKTYLKDNLNSSNFQTWINPLLFEREDSGAVLRCPNPFFMNWVKSHFTKTLEEAMSKCGLVSWRLDLMTEEQLKTAALVDSKKIMEPAPCQPAPNQETNLEGLPVSEQFDLLYQLYPRGERKDKARTVFQNLSKIGVLPQVSDLISAIKRAQNNNPSWQRDNGRYIPQLHKWLSERRWMD